MQTATNEPEPVVEDVKKRKRQIVLSDSEEDEEEEKKKIKTATATDLPEEEKDVKMKESLQELDNEDITTKVVEMTVDSQQPPLEHSDDETFDQEVEEAAKEEKEAKKEKLEMMSIIHTM